MRLRIWLGTLVVIARTGEFRAEWFRVWGLRGLGFRGLGFGGLEARVQGLELCNSNPHLRRLPSKVSGLVLGRNPDL